MDGLRHQRLDRPYVRRQGRLVEASWNEALDAIAARLKDVDSDRVAAIVGDQCDAEAMLALKELMTALGSQAVECRQDGAQLDTSVRGAYLFNAGIAGIDRADVILLVGSNPRWEAPVLNARIRKRHLAGRTRIALIGDMPVDLTYPVERLGAGPATLQQLADGKLEFLDVLKNAKNPLIIVGQGALRRPDGAAVLAQVRALAEAAGVVRDDWNGFCVLHTAAARVAGLDLKLVTRAGVAGIYAGCEKGDIEAVYLLAADEIDAKRLGKAFVIYQGHHGDTGAHRADVVLPGAAYTEKPGIYINTEGRVQLARRASFPPGDAREDWTILRALSAALGKKLPYDSLDQVRQALVKANPVFAAIDSQAAGAWGPFGSAGPLDAAPLASPIGNYFMTCPVSRASQTMAACTAARQAPAAVAAE
jgi:NADH-quinone oxidoreductase subunit G